VREPGIAWWPGRIEAGSRTDALAATYDIFPTVLALAGAPPPPPGLVIDGVDLSGVLFDGALTAHDCIPIYNDPHAPTAPDPTNLAAMRCHNHKVFWWTDCLDPGCPSGVPVGLQPPDHLLVFNLVDDPGERTPLAPTHPEYGPAVAAAEAARTAHLATLDRFVPDQMGRGTDRNLAICGAPHSQIRYPYWYGDRFSTEIYTLGCHWFPRLLASSKQVCD
jgi:arylsulfatase A-like enzyme